MTGTGTTRGVGLSLNPSSMVHDTLRYEVPIEQLASGTRFCMRTPSAWGYPETKVYGELIRIDAGRARVLLSAGQHQVIFGTTGPDGEEKVRVFEAQGAAEVNWPRDITVEPLEWAGNAAPSSLRDEDPEERSSVMSDTQVTQAAGIQARYDYNVKALAKAEEAGDTAKVVLLEGKIVQIKNEAELKGVTLHPTGKAQLEQAQTNNKDKSQGQGKGAKPSGKAQIQQKMAKATSPNPSPKVNQPTAEERKAMEGLDKAKNKAEGKKEPPKPRSTHDCLCGCGQETLSLFAPGHDARVKGIILKVERGHMKPDDIPETVQPFVKFKGKWGTDQYTLTAAPVKIPGRPEVAHTGIEALEAMDV